MQIRTLSRVLFAASLLPASTALAALQVHLPFDENVGTTSFNAGATGAGNDVSFSPNNTRSAGLLGGALDFDNTSSSAITAGTNPIPADVLRTISFWINTTQSTGGQRSALSFGTNNNPPDSTSPGTKFDIDLDTNTGALEVGVGGGRMDSAAATITTPALNDGTWRLATVVVPDFLDDDAGVFDISDIDIYVDGVFSYNGTSNNSADRTVSTAPGGSLFLGRAANSSGFQNIDASLDDVAVWDNPLSPDEIKGLFDVGSALGVNAGVYDQVLGLHDAGIGTIFAGDYSWTFAGGLSGSAGVTGSELVLDDAANTGVTFTALVPGDVNRNGVADINDFNIIQSNFLDSATSRDDGDLNGDGLVDFTDFRIWKDASGSSASGTVPEPGVVALLACGLLSLAGLRRRQCRGALIALFVVAGSLGLAERGAAQVTNVFFVPSSGDYDTPGNWDTGFLPEALLDEFAIIGSNSADAILVGASDDASATLSTNTLSPAALQLGQGAGAIGRLTVQSGGSISVPGTVTATQGLDVGFGENGRGFLTIEGGGSVSALSVSLNGPTDGLDESEWSTIDLSGDASLTTTTEGITFNRVFNVSGPDVVVDSAADLNIGARGRYNASITGATHSVLKAAGNINIDGGGGATLIPTFSGGAAPTEGSSWDLFDSATISGTFQNVRFPGRVPGQGFVLEQRPGGNGVITSLAIRSTLVLEVNRDTGEATITQPFGSPVSLDGYSIESAAGNLGPSTWNSLDDQNLDGDWTEANASTTALNELKPTTDSTITGAAGISIGQAYTPDFSTFGQVIDEDLAFEYFDTTTGQLVLGEVIYSGVKVNDLTLIVDPATGDAQLRNTSDESVSLDGYQITSTSGALISGSWDSLEDQAIGSWVEADASSTSLAELLPFGVEEIDGDSGFNLGSIFNTTGDQDIVLEYFQSGANVLQAGTVLYTELPDLPPSFLLGDADGDGDVDGDDLIAVQTQFGNIGPTPLLGDADNDGDVDGDDLIAVQTEFGNTLSVAVPEPGAAGLLALAAACPIALVRRRRHGGSSPQQRVSTMQPKTLAGPAVAAALALSLGVPAAGQATLFDHNFENAPNPGTAVTSVGDLGAPATGSLSFSGSPIGGIGGARPALAVGFNSNGIANMTEPAENSVTFSGTFPETQVADAGTGDRVFADLSSPGDITSTSLSTDISFSFGHFGTANTGGFKHSYIRGLDGVGNEVFELLFVAGSANNTRQWYARGASDDSIELTAANMGTPDGQLLADGFGGAFNSTNVANGRPAEAMLVDISLSSSMVTFDISSTNGTGTPTAVNGMALPINSAATSLSRLEFGTLWNASVSGQNNGYWLDDLFVGTTPIGSFPDGDVDLDGFVDLDDFNIITANFKSSVSSRTQGDLNDDGFVDFTDFRIWKDNSGGSSTTVPEPSAALLAAVALVGLARRRRPNV